MKEVLISTGSLQEVTAVAKQLYSKSVTDTTKKPVTKKMLKEQYHWDEFLA